MRILALDVGTKRIGIAVSDALGIIAQGVKSLEVKDENQAIDDIVNLAKEKEAQKVIAGLPLNMDGTHSRMTELVLGFIEKLKAKLAIPIETWDERLTSAQVQRDLIFMDVSRKKRKKVNDMLAAQIILQNYLDVKSNVQKDNSE